MSKQPYIDQLDQAIAEILANPDAAPSAVDASLLDLLQIARDLRDLPGPDFKLRLRAELEGKASMSTQTVQFRSGFRTVTPYISLPAVEELIAFVKQVFGAVETHRAGSGPGAIHAELRIGDCMLMIGGGPAYKGPARPASIRVFVDDPDDVYQRALNAGAVSMLGMTEDHGERYAAVSDPFGNMWIISTHRAELLIPEHDRTLTPFMYAKGSGAFIDFLKQAFAAEELVRVDLPDGNVKHAVIRIGDSVIAAGELRAGQTHLPAMTYLYVPDADAV